MLADQVQHGQDGLAVGPPQTTPDLLQEDRRALCGAQQQDRVDLRKVESFVEEVG